MTSNRQLAAIMFTDIVGYTTLMGSDESMAMSVLKSNRNIHKRLIKKYGGKWLKEMGDGTLSSFKTISDAVYCAGELIKTCTDEKIELRVGIHFGEISEEQGDIFGDGVNVASRIEPLAKPGQILASGSIHRNVKNLQGIQSTFLEEKQLKNVDDLLKIYSIDVNESEIKPIFKSKAKIPLTKVIVIPILVISVLLAIYFISFSLNSKKSDIIKSDEASIAILPFKNLSSNNSYDYYINGLVEDLLTKLSQYKKLRLISRTTSELYKDTDKSIPVIGQELNVRYIVEGSGRIINDNLKVTVQLIDSKLDKHMWAIDTVVVFDDILNLQNVVADRISTNLKSVLLLDENNQINQKLTENHLAYDYYLKAIADTLNDVENVNKAIHLLKKAIDIDQNFDMAWAYLSGLYLDKINVGGEYSLFIDSAKFAAETAIEINPLNSTAYYYYSQVYTYLNNREQSFENLKKAYEMGTDNSVVFYQLSWHYREKKNYEESAIVLLNGLSRSLIYDPTSEDFYASFGWAFINGHSVLNAEKTITKGLELSPRSMALSNGMWAIGIAKKDYSTISKYNKILYKAQPDFNYYKHRYAQSLLRSNQIKEAEKLYEDIIKINKEFPDNTGVIDLAGSLYELGFIKIKLGNEKEGRLLINKYINLRLNNEKFNYDLARCYALLGEYDQMNNYLKNSTSISIWWYYNDPLFEDVNLPQNLLEFIQENVENYEIEMKEIGSTFDRIYEKLISSGQIKRIDDFL